MYENSSIRLDHGELTDNSSSRESTKRTIYNCTGPGSMYAHCTRYGVLYRTQFVYNYTRSVQKLF